MSLSIDLENIYLEPLNKASFANFGDVIQCAEQDFFHINDAHTERYHAIAMSQADQAQTGMSIFRNIKATELPCTINMLERHPLGSQAFIPMHGQAFLVVVAPALDANQPDLSQLRVFITNGQQGVNYHAGTWHHPLLTLEAPSQFVVVDRIGTGHNCDVVHFTAPVQLCAT